MSEQYYWRTEEDGVFEIGGERIDLLPTGAEYAKQFGKLSAWLGTHGITGLAGAYDSGILDESTSDYEQASKLIAYIMGEGLGPDAMIELAEVLTGKNKKFVEDNFDPGWFVDAIMIVLDERPGYKLAFSRVWQRFFLATGTDTGVEEDQAQD